MAQRPDDEPLGDGEPISQDALDALLAASSNTGEIDDGAAFDGFGQADESDLNFGTDDAASEAAAAPASLGEDAGGFGGAAFDPGAFGGGDMSALDFAAFQTLEGGEASATGDADFMRVRDIPLDVTVELGRTRLLIKDILDLSTGAIIELDKVAGEPVDLFANGLLVARGEVIVIDDNFGVRVTEIITAEDRIKAQYEQSLAA